MRKGCLNRMPFDLRNAEKFLNSIKSEDFKVYPKNAKGDEPAELLVYDVVGKDWDGSGIGAKDVAGFLAENRGKPINVRINSPGGLVYDGLTIYNSLIAHDAPVTATIEGIAASIASIIAMGAEKVRMSAVASMMVHRAMGVCIGNVSDMTDCGDWLNTIDNQLAAVYAAKTGRKVDTMKKYMVGAVDGTLFSAESALEAKLIDEIIPVRGEKKGAKNEAASDKPDNCTCEYPDVKLRNGSGHKPPCACHAEWEAAGGFDRNRSESQVRDELAKSLAAETHRKIMIQKAAARLRVMEVSGE